ncbi:MAG: cysteine--tRNA ligase [bacterium]
MALYVYDHVSRSKRKFESVRPGQVGMYVCGMTVQDKPHVGHMFAFVACDMIRRYLEYLGYEVEYLQNFTDVDDKIIDKAREEGVEYKVVAQRNMDLYYEYADKLGIKRATRYPLATEHIDEIIAYTQQLISQDHAYAAAGDVYFDVRSFDDYGWLSGRNVDDMRSGVRIEVGEKKRDPLDFALWKAAREGEPAWDSPWGPGRPGWHIECSVMSTKYLGETFDFHGGGRDLLFPHHENERAQSLCGTNGTFVNYWLHSGLLFLGDKKMSKSDGNFFAIDDVVAQFRPEVLRFFLLNAHFRSQLDYSEDRLHEAEAAYERLGRGVSRLLDRLAADVDPVPAGLVSSGGETLNKILDKHEQRFFAAMDDDFNSGGALGVLFALVRDLNQYFAEVGEQVIDREPLIRAQTLFEKANTILNIFPAGLDACTAARDTAIPPEITALVTEREAARASKDWAKADTLRDQIQALGFVLEDSSQGTKARRA